MKNTYSVIVGDIGCIPCVSKIDAKKTFKIYVDMSINGEGKAGGESVYLMENEEPIKEYLGTLCEVD